MPIYQVAYIQFSVNQFICVIILSMEIVWYIVEVALQLLTIYFVGAVIVLACSMITLVASFPNDMKDFDDKIHGINIGNGRWFHITVIVLGFLCTYYFGIEVTL